MAEINLSIFSGYNDSAVVAHRSDDSDSALFMLYYVVCCVVLALGIPGNILSAIVWLRVFFCDVARNRQQLSTSRR